MTTLHPLWKEAVETIRARSESDPEAHFSDEEIEALVGERCETREYSFALLGLRDELLKKHGIVLVRKRNLKTYKIANDQEKLHDESERLFRRSRNALFREVATLWLVDAENLSDDDKALLGDRRRRCGVRMLSTSPRIARKMMKHVELDNRTVRKWTALLDHREYDDE